MQIKNSEESPSEHMRRTLSDEVNVAILQVGLMRSVLQPMHAGWYRHWSNGADKVCAAADAADSLAKEMHRANRIGKSAYRSTRLSDQKQALRRAVSECQGWGRTKRDDGDNWLSAVLPSNPNLTWPAMNPTDAMPFGNPASLEAHAVDLRRAAEEMLTGAGQPPLSRPGRPIERAEKEPLIRLLAAVANRKHLPASEIARRAVAMGMVLDRKEPPKPTRGTMRIDPDEWQAERWTKVLVAAGAAPEDPASRALALVAKNPGQFGIGELIRKLGVAHSFGAEVRALIDRGELEYRGRRLYPGSRLKLR